MKVLITMILSLFEHSAEREKEAERAASKSEYGTAFDKSIMDRTR
jgi:hypothetical protein